jgi:hypothetical protein
LAAIVDRRNLVGQRMEANFPEQNLCGGRISLSAILPEAHTDRCWEM